MVKKQFKYRSVSESEQRMFNDVKTFLVKQGVKQELLYNILLAISEGFTNALVHGNNYDSGKYIEINLAVNDEEVFADIIDEGNCDLEAINTRKPAGKLQEGGRGIDLIEYYADGLKASKSETTGGLKLSMSFRRNRCNLKKVRK